MTGGFLNPGSSSNMLFVTGDHKLDWKYWVNLLSVYHTVYPYRPSRVHELADVGWPIQPLWPF